MTCQQNKPPSPKKHTARFGRARASNVHRTLVLVAVHEDLIVDEESPERKLVETVERFARIAVEIERVRRRVADAFRIDRIEVGRIGGMVDFRYVRRFLLAQIGLEVDALEECVRLHFVGVFAQPPFGGRAQAQNQVGRLARQIRHRRYVQALFVVDDLGG